MDLVQLDFSVHLLDLVQLDFDVEGAIAYLSKLRRACLVTVLKIVWQKRVLF